MATYKVNCAMQKNPQAVTVKVVPFQQEVKDHTSTVIWEAQGAGTTFPETDFFAWKTGGSGTMPVRSGDGKTLTLTYSQDTGSQWAYMLTLENEGCRVVIDPEIHNDPPPRA